LCQQFATKPFRLRGQSTALVVGKSHTPIADLFPKNPILLDQVLDDMLLMLVHPASDRYDNKRKWVQSGVHRRTLPSRRTLFTINHLNEFEFLNTTIMRFRSDVMESSFCEMEFAESSGSIFPQWDLPAKKTWADFQ